MIWSKILLTGSSIWSIKNHPAVHSLDACFAGAYLCVGIKNILFFPQVVEIIENSLVTVSPKIVPWESERTVLHIDYCVIIHANLKATIICKVMQALTGRKKKGEGEWGREENKLSFWFWALKGEKSLFSPPQHRNVILFLVFFCNKTLKRGQALKCSHLCLQSGTSVLCRSGCGYSVSCCDRTACVFQWSHTTDGCSGEGVCKENLWICMYDSMEVMVTFKKNLVPGFGGAQSSLWEYDFFI